VVAHETTHALLDGLHPSFNEGTNPDVHALHEGFADVVALLQRFAHPTLLEHQIARTRGDLEQQNLLGELGQQFGLALGMRGALRSALGEKKDGQWVPHQPDPRRLAASSEPHNRGAVFLAAVFSAFVAVYKLRSADLFRIASGGTGVLGPGAIHPDLVRRLAREAAAAAEAVLTMCIRGLDYCPPVDINFGTYLRAVITADAEVWPQERYPYRAAFAEAFRQWGIFPDGARGMGESELRFPQLDDPEVRALTGRPYDQTKTKELFGKLNLDWGLTADRAEVWQQMRRNGAILHKWLTGQSMRDQLPAFGLTLERDAPPTVSRSLTRIGEPALEVHSVRVARRRGFRETEATDLVVEIRQRRRGYLTEDAQQAADSLPAGSPSPPADFTFRRGCTLIIDPLTQTVRYAIPTFRDVSNEDALSRVRDYLRRRAGSAENPFYGPPGWGDQDAEPFAALHRHTDSWADFA
jgi:hypothetical protein